MEVHEDKRVIDCNHEAPFLCCHSYTHTHSITNGPHSQLDPFISSGGKNFLLEFLCAETNIHLSFVVGGTGNRVCLVEINRENR